MIRHLSRRIRYTHIEYIKSELLALKPHFGNIDIAVALLVPFQVKATSLGLPSGLRNFRNGYTVKHTLTTAITSEHYVPTGELTINVLCRCDDTYEVHVNGATVRVSSMREKSPGRWVISTTEGTFERDVFIYLTTTKVYIDKHSTTHLFDEDGDPISFVIKSDQLKEDTTKPK
jgi:hypothetical protein